MKIEKLRLEGYKRLLLRNIKSFEISPNSIYQIIIGTNGSGKSSVMRELSPLPANGKDFVRGGTKTIELTHRGVHYTLISEFSVGNGKHSFIVGGENLNPGGTATVQKALVKQHLAYDEQLHKVLMGITKFSTMPALARRDILVEMSGANLDYAMDLWMSLKTKMRDQQGVIKHLNGRLAQETEKLLNPEQLKTLNEESDVLTDELTILMEAREPNLPDRNSVKQRLQQTLQTIYSLAEDIDKLSFTQPGWMKEYNIRNMTQFQNLAMDVNGKQNRIEASLEKYHEEWEEIRQIVEALEATNAEGIDGLKAQMEELRKERAIIEKSLQHFFDVSTTEAREAYVQTIALYPQVTDVFSHLPDNSDRKFSRQARNDAGEKKQQKRQEIEAVRKELAKIEHRLEHIKTAKEENCPKCGYIWQPGIHGNETEQLQQKQYTLQHHLTQLEHQYADIETYLEQFATYSELYRRYQHLVETAVALNPFWEYVLENERQLIDPPSVLPMFDVWREDIKRHADMFDIDVKLHLFATALDRATAVTGGEAYDQRIVRLQTSIEDLTEESIEQKGRISDLYSFGKEVDTALRKYWELQRKSEELSKDVDVMVRILRNEAISNCINGHQGQLAQVRSSLNTANAVLGIVNDLTASLDVVKEDWEAYKILVNEISPTDGLIAEQLRGFMNAFVDQVNAIIDQVWTYELKLLPCGLEDTGLDYKFGLMVQGEKAGDDVRDSDASTGQLEMIDFAFKLVAMLYLGMEDYPLYLDELGPHMDEEHRNNIMRFVHTLVDTKKCSQMWLVSHFAAMHGIFNNSEYCVMDDRNIAVPPVSNKHVVFG